LWQNTHKNGRNESFFETFENKENKPFFRKILMTEIYKMAAGIQQFCNNTGTVCKKKYSFLGVKSCKRRTMLKNGLSFIL
jgi:hypothetical protein